MLENILLFFHASDSPLNNSNAATNALIHLVYKLDTFSCFAFFMVLFVNYVLLELIIKNLWDFDNLISLVLFH